MPDPPPILPLGYDSPSQEPSPPLPSLTRAVLLATMLMTTMECVIWGITALIAYYGIGGIELRIGPVIVGIGLLQITGIMVYEMVRPTAWARSLMVLAVCLNLMAEAAWIIHSGLFSWYSFNENTPLSTMFTPVHVACAAFCIPLLLLYLRPSWRAAFLPVR